MTTKEIAKSVNKTERSIRNWIKKVAENNSLIREKFSLSSPVKPANYNLGETILIIEKGLGKNAAFIYKQNAENQHRTNEQITFSDMMLSIKSLADTVKLSMVNYDNRLSNLENKFEERKALLPAPEKTDRDNLNEIVRRYVNKTGFNYPYVWGLLYKEAYYVLHINLKERASNRNMTIIDYVESKNIMSELLSIAIKLFK